MSCMFADIVFNRPIQPLTYKVPEEFSKVLPGMRVRVPLKSKTTVGIVYRIKKETEYSDLKQIVEVLDTQPVINSDLIETAEWIAQYYLCSIGEALWTIIPKGVKKREVDIDLGELYGTDVIGYDDVLPREGTFIQRGEEEAHPGNFSGRRRGMELHSISSGDIRSGAISLTEDQESVYRALSEGLEKKEAGQYLLHGVTGSGKTEIYLRIIHDVFSQGRGAILLVPEISLTPQTVRYFLRRVGNELAILHSRLTKAEKINTWHRILSGEKRIVIGARSAIFAPLRNIGIIIIDEEHETSYKSDETPRYNAKSVAYYRAKKHGALLLLGSATPSVESYYLSKLGKITLLQLPKRVLNQKLPFTHIADLRKVRGEKYISKHLLGAIEKRLKQNEQVILFLNRRGFSPHVYCENCGYVFRCKNCDITLTYHKKERRLRCHYCGYSQHPPDTCPICRDEHVSFSGFGTEKIEGILNEHYPGAVVVRMDTDTVRRRLAIGEILGAFSKKQIDILIGTQIVSKGLHFPNVTLVGVLNADIPLNFPDFRSAERTFNLITQVAGRAGRSQKGGEVIIQTYNPSHYAIQTAKNQDYEEFFSREIKYRQALIYPPFCRIVRLVFRGTDQEILLEAGGEAIKFIKGRTTGYLSILGPSLCPLSRIKSNYRVHVIIKLERITPILPVLRDLQNEKSMRGKFYLEIDIDPLSML